MNPRHLDLPLPWPAPGRVARLLPSYLLNGVGVGVGLVVITSLIGAVAGLPAAMAASSGAAAVSVADTVVAPGNKWRQMLPAALGAGLVALLVQLTHAHTWLLGLLVLAVTFCGVMWMSWGKRGGPQTFVLVMALVFQMAGHSSLPLEGRAAWIHLAWVIAGGGLLAGWSMLAARVLAPRYRVLAVVDCLQAVAQLMQSQAQWVSELLDARHPGVSDAALLGLVRQQAGIADPLQHARDLLYAQPQGRTEQLASALIRIVDMRDQALACQLDLDTLARAGVGRAALPHLARAMRAQAEDLLALAEALQHARPLPPARSIETEMLAMSATAEAAATRHAWPSTLAGMVAEPAEPAPPPVPGAPPRPADALLIVRALGNRMRHIARDRSRVAEALRGEAGPLPVGPDGLRTFVSPGHWPLAVLRAHLHWRSPICRYALRATLAMGCAFLLAQALPWGAHKHWLLMTVAVVMRGSLEQTLLRRNARVVGTLVGCLAAALLLEFTQEAVPLFAALAIALTLAHAYVLVDYRVTSAAGAMLALLQSHMLAAGTHAMHVAALERLADTLIGAAIAWAFSYVLPAWEREQLPTLVRRLLRAQGEYARAVLNLHKPSQVAGSERSWRNARREVYDVLWLLTQTLQRMGKEPEHVREAMRTLEAVLVRSHRFTTHLAAVKTLLTIRRADLDLPAASEMLAEAEQRLVAVLQPGSQTPAWAHSQLPDEWTEVGELPADPDKDPTPWLRRRLKLAVAEARDFVAAAEPLFTSPGRSRK